MKTNEEKQLVLTLEDLKNAVFADGEKISSEIKTRERDKWINVTELPEAEPVAPAEEVKDGKIQKFPPIVKKNQYDLSGDSPLRLLKDFAVGKMNITVQASIRKLVDATQYMKDNPNMKVKTSKDLSGHSEAVKKQDESVVACNKILAILDSEMPQSEKNAAAQAVWFSYQEPMRTVVKFFFQGTLRERPEAAKT